jgi:gas vesicle protein
MCETAIENNPVTMEPQVSQKAARSNTVRKLYSMADSASGPSDFEYTEKRETQMDDDKKLSYFFLGLGIGVAVGILFAPKSGEETRALIRGKAEEGKDYVKRRSDELRDSASDLIERGRTAVSRQRDNLTAAVEAGKQAYREAVATGGSEEA